MSLSPKRIYRVIQCGILDPDKSFDVEADDCAEVAYEYEDTIANVRRIAHRLEFYKEEDGKRHVVALFHNYSSVQRV